MNTTRFAKVGAVCAGALALLLAGTPAAVADPNPPAFRSFAAVGSDTIQDVWNGLTNGIASVNGGVAVLPSIASYDAFGSATIKTKSSGPTFARPAGSGAGVRALSASNNAPFTYEGTGIQGQVDFARSSSGPSSSFPGNDLTYLPFARDAVSVVGRSLDSDLINFTTAELTALYSCQTSGNIRVSGTTVKYVNGTTVNQTIRPQLPQSASGTRSFFLSAIGVTSPGTCVTQAGAPENDGRALTGSGQVIPFSVGQWIAQKNGVVSNTLAASGLRLFRINNLAGTTGSGTALRPGALYGSAATPPTPGVGTFARDTYSVVDSSDVIAGSSDTLLETRLSTTLRTTNAKAVISRYGFLNLGYLGAESLYRTSGYTN